MALSIDIYTILRANASLVTAVGTKIYPVIAPEKVTLPCLVYTLTSLNPNETKPYDNLYDECYVTVTVISNTLADAEAGGNLVRTAMVNYTGTIISDKIHGITMISQNWQYIPDMSYSASPSGVGVFAVESQFRIQAALNIAE